MTLALIGNKGFKPLDACRDIPTMEEIKFPVFGSTKLDGVRVLIRDGKLWSKRNKLIPNEYLTRILGKSEFNGLDGEILCKGDFNDVQSNVMSVGGKFDFTFNVFDDFTIPDMPFIDRHRSYVNRVSQLNHENITYVTGLLLGSIEEVKTYYERALTSGFEGVMLRDPKGVYKYGRSTMKQGILLKLKPFDDYEAEILSVIELMRNTDTSSQRKENLVPADTLGALECKSSDNGECFNLGTGFSAEERHRLWLMKDNLPGKKLTYKCQGLTKYGKPRFPVYKGLRPEVD